MATPQLPTNTVPGRLAAWRLAPARPSPRPSPRPRRVQSSNSSSYQQLAPTNRPRESSSGSAASAAGNAARQQLPRAVSLDDGGDDMQQDLVACTFKWPAALGGERVSVVGSFNGWTTPVPLGRTASGDCVRSLCLPSGRSIQFKFVVDGDWVTSPCEQLVADGGGNYNNYRLIQPTVRLDWRGPVIAGPVLVTGDWNSYGELVPLQHNPATGVYELRACLPPGTYTYHFLVDDAWQVCPQTDTTHIDGGLLANKVEVRAPPAFSIFYATGWQESVLRVRLLNPDGTPQHPGWREVPMHNTASRSQPKGGLWKTAVISAPRPQQEGQPGLNGDGAEGAVYGGLEFYITNGDGTKEDRPWRGGTYRLHHPGGYKLRSGRVLPFPKATQPPMMLVSDLDGTMVGDTHEANTMTSEFCQYWEENSALANCVLVYNTGRSLGSFVHLFQEKNGTLALPDVLITAVGTKIFRLDTEGGTRGTASGTYWREDLQWARSLDAGWDLNRVRGVARGVVERSSGAVHWLDEGTEHPHRIALTVRADMVAHVVEQLKGGTHAAGVQAQVIVSGVGDWRYVDCVSVRAGKLAALEYVRTLYGIARERCVAAGDSGNDTLMLGGRNKAVVVGNAQPELVQWFLQQPQTERLVMSDAPLARGLLEGLARHGLF